MIIFDNQKKLKEKNNIKTEKKSLNTNYYREHILDLIKVWTCPNCWEETENWKCTKLLLECWYWHWEDYFKKMEKIKKEEKNRLRCSCWDYATKWHMCEECYYNNMVLWNY